MSENAMRRRRVIICDTDRDLLKTLSYYFAVRGDYDVFLYHEPVFCSAWTDDAECSSPCADVIIAGDAMPGVAGVALYNTQSRRGCAVSIKNKALVCRGFEDTGIREIMEAGCVILEKPVDLNKITAWMHHRERLMDLSSPLTIKRKEERHASTRMVEYSVHPARKTFRGISINTSSSGLCLKTRISLRFEQTLTIHPSRVASVRWSNRVEGGSYLIGLQFVQPNI